MQKTWSERSHTIYNQKFKILKILKKGWGRAMVFLKN